MKGQQGDITHREAADEYGNVVSIRDALAHREYQCLDCDPPETVIVKRGRVRAEHFAHKEPGGKTGPMTELHRLAQRSILEGFQRSAAEGTPYLAGVKCRRCRKDFDLDLTVAASRCAMEHHMPGISAVPDLMFFDQSDSPFLVVEVEVTHPLSRQKSDAYLAAGLALIVIRPPSLAHGAALARGIPGEAFSIGFDSMCTCHSATVQSEAEETEPVLLAASESIQLQLGLDDLVAGEGTVLTGSELAMVGSLGSEPPREEPAAGDSEAAGVAPPEEQPGVDWGAMVPWLVAASLLTKPNPPRRKPWRPRRGRTRR